MEIKCHLLSMKQFKNKMLFLVNYGKPSFKDLTSALYSFLLWAKAAPRTSCALFPYSLFKSISRVLAKSSGGLTSSGSTQIMLSKWRSRETEGTHPGPASCAEQGATRGVRYGACSSSTHTERAVTYSANFNTTPTNLLKWVYDRSQYDKS